jgi:hypothetical protein
MEDHAGDADRASPGKDREDSTSDINHRGEVSF